MPEEVELKLVCQECGREADEGYLPGDRCVRLVRERPRGPWVHCDGRLEMEGQMKKRTKAVPVRLDYAKDWCGYCQTKTKVKRTDLEEAEFEFWECKKCKLIEEYRKQECIYE